MRSAAVLVLILMQLGLTAHRLPAWQSDLTIWVAAVESDTDDPWALTNAAHYSHDARTMRWYAQLLRLPVPEWLPLSEREPYRVGYESAKRTLIINGYQAQAAGVANALTRLNHPEVAPFQLQWVTQH